MIVRHPLQADGGADLLPFLIYMLIFLIWIVSRTVAFITKGKRPGKSPTEQAEPKPQPVLDESLREFLEKVTGTSPAPPKPPQLPPQETMTPARRLRDVLRPTTPEVQPSPTRQRYAPPARREIIPARRPPETAPETKAVEELPSVEEMAVTEPEPRIRLVLGSVSALAGLDAMRMSMPSLQLPRISPTDTVYNQVDLRQPQAARRAMIERIVLGPPRCMSPDPEEIHF